MNVERLLQISIATLTVLGPLLLGAGDQFAALPLWVFLAAIASLWLTDTIGWLQLNRTLTNVAAIGAVLLSAGELAQFRGGVDILSVARLLVYLQVILLFQRKEFRTYWQLALLSLLQVIVAAAFNQGSSFGLLMIAYLFVGIATLAIFFLHRERVLAERAPPSPSPSPSEASRWPLIAETAEFVGSRATMSGGLGPEFWRRLLKMTAGSLLLTAVIFSAVPRLGSGAWYGAGLSLQRMVGFNDVVTLGALGTVIENPQEVLTAEFFDNATEQSYQVLGGVYFRGTVLTDYSNGTWTSSGQARGRAGRRELDPVGPAEREGLVRQELTIQPMDREELFCVWPFVGIRHDERMQVAPMRQRLLRPEASHTRFTYELGTTALEDHTQKPIVPAKGRVNPYGLTGMPSSADTKGVPELVRVAEQWLDESDLPEEDLLGRAQWLEHMLRDSGEFQYSLQGQLRQADIDPIEDFIKNNRRGHCEYFATALALMLRSQEIPARVVVGFKTNEWNELGQFYQVRQLHAHTWVEAFFPPQYVPPELLHADRPWQWADGAWVRLDATPAARDLGLEGGTSLWSKLDTYFTWLDYVWSSYVMDMDRPRQEEAIYNPVIGALRSLWRKLTDVEWWNSMLGSLGATVRDRLLWLLSGEWLNWRGLLGTTAVLAVMTLAFAGLRRLWRRLFPAVAPDADGAARRRIQVDFYCRLEALLARLGLERAATQTQREFARRARAALIESAAGEVAATPTEVVEAFYRVRFGGTALDKEQAEAVERALKRLAAASVER